MAAQSPASTPGTPGTPRNCIAVTGGTGFLGRHTVHQLLNEGWTVRALARSRDKAQRTFPGIHEGLSFIIGDAADEGALRDLTAGCFAAVNTVGIRREMRPDVTFEHSHVRATARLIEAAQRAGVARFVQVSALGVRPNAPTEYQRSKFRAESLVRASGLNWTIIRPSMLIGPGGEFIGMVKQWMTGDAPPYFAIPYFQRIEGGPVVPGAAPAPGGPRFVDPHVQPVSVIDVARCIAGALRTDEAIGEVYNLGGREAMPWPAFLERCRDAIGGAGSNKQVFGIPAPAGWMMAMGARFAGLDRLLPFGPSEPVMAAEDSVCSNDKVRRDLGVDPMGLDDALAFAV